MTKAKLSLVLTLNVLMLISTFNVVAHQQKAAITKVFFNPRTQNIEVMHRFVVHDAEHAVKELFDKNADLLNSKKTQSEFADYVAARFSLYNQEQEPLPLNLVGTELDGKHFWVYQETPQSVALKGLYVKHNALRDLWITQTNTLNVEGLGDVKTLTFTDNVEILNVTL